MIRRSDIPLAWVLAGWLLVAALIAFNRGIDLLWGMVILLASALVIGFVLPRWQLRSVGIERKSFPSSGTVGQPMTLTYSLHAPAWPSRHGIEICESLTHEATPVTVAHLAEVRGNSEISFKLIPWVRGVFHLRDIVAESRYPLGLSTSQRRIAVAPHRLTVYPDAFRLNQIPVEGQALASQEHHVNRRRGGSEEFFALRPWRPGDETHAIHWRSSARLGELVTREYERQQDTRLQILLEQSKDRHLGSGMRSTFEYMVRIAHSVAIRARMQGVPVGLICRVDGESAQIVPGTDDTTYMQIREALAAVNLDSGPPLRDTRKHLTHRAAGGSWLTFNLSGNTERNSLIRQAALVGARVLVIEFDVSSFTQAPGGRPGRIINRATAYGWLATVPCDADLTELFKLS